MSPPYFKSEVLKQTLNTLSVICMINGETPKNKQGRRIFGEMRRFFPFSRKVLRLLHKNQTTQIAETACEIIVASAAPRTPI